MTRKCPIIELSQSKRRGLSRAGRPFVLVNMSMTTDGKIATSNRAVDSFGSKRDLAHLYELRATVDAVMCGAGTINAGDVHLDPGPERYRRLRKRRGLAEYNLRVIASGRGLVRTNTPIFAERHSPIIVITTARASGRSLERLATAADEIVVCGSDSIDWPAALGWLRKRWNITRLLCEGGGELNASLFCAGAVDELHLTICPYLFGGRHAPTIADGVGMDRLADAVQLELVSMRQTAEELFCVFRVLSPKSEGAIITTNSPRQRASQNRA